MLKLHGNGRFHVFSTWNTCGAFAGMLNLKYGYLLLNILKLFKATEIIEYFEALLCIIV